MGMAFSTFCRNYRGHSCSNSALFEDESGALAEEAEVGVENGFVDDPDEEALGVPPPFDSFVDDGPSTYKKVLVPKRSKLVIFSHFISYMYNSAEFEHLTINFTQNFNRTLFFVRLTVF